MLGQSTEKILARVDFGSGIPGVIGTGGAPISGRPRNMCRRLRRRRYIKTSPGFRQRGSVGDHDLLKERDGPVRRATIVLQDRFSIPRPTRQSALAK